MRTVIFIGLMTIAESIGVQSGYVMEGLSARVGAMIFAVAVVMDVIDFARNR